LEGDEARKKSDGKGSDHSEEEGDEKHGGCTSVDTKNMGHVDLITAVLEI
jgi:hypothetical protein